MSEKDLDLGLVTKTGIIDRAVADAAFALKEGEVSAPIKGMFGTTLVKVVKIEPEQVKKFEEVAAEIKQTLATDRARSEIASRHDKIEDERGGGAAADRDRAEARPHRPHDRGGRPHRARSRRASRSPAGRAASIRSAARSAPTSASTASRCRSPAAAMSGTRCSASSRRASARSTRCARRSRSAGATRRSPSGCKAKADRDARQAQGRHVVRRCRGRRGPERADHVRPQARRQSGNAISPRVDRGGVRDREGRRRQRRGQQSGRMGRVPADRHHGAGLRRRLGGGKAHRRRACAAR